MLNNKKECLILSKGDLMPPLRFVGQSKRLHLPIKSEIFDMPDNIPDSTPGLVIMGSVESSISFRERRENEIFFDHYGITNKGEHLCYLTREGWHKLKPEFQNIVDMAIDACSKLPKVDPPTEFAKTVGILLQVEDKVKSE